MKIKTVLTFFMLLAAVGPVSAQNPVPVALWTFDNIRQTETVKPLTRKWMKTPEIYRNYAVRDTINGKNGQILGAFHKRVPGVVGHALQLDGNTSFVEAASASVSGDFSVGAWLALGAYPTNWCPIADQQVASGRGFFLGVDALGHAGFRAFVGGKWQVVTSTERIPLRTWTHLAGVFSPTDGLMLYLNGKAVVTAKTTGDVEPATGATLLIGKSSTRQKPAGTVRPNATAEVNTFLDGIVDELAIFDTALSVDYVAGYVKRTATTAPPALPARSLPLAGTKAGSPTVRKFGAIYTKLAYYEAWDKLWPVNEQADVVVQFDNSPAGLRSAGLRSAGLRSAGLRSAGLRSAKFVFWRGTSYIPHWITENGIWYNNEFLETFGPTGSYEPMSDKRCTYSHVRVLENTDARAVIHWRYALMDNFNEQARVDSLTGFGEWALHHLSRWRWHPNHHPPQRTTSNGS